MPEQNGSGHVLGTGSTADLGGHVLRTGTTADQGGTWSLLLARHEGAQTNHELNFEIWAYAGFKTLH